MTIRERVDSAAVEELPKLAAEIAEAEAALRLRLARASVPEPTDDMAAEEIASELKVHVQTVYKWARRRVDPIPSKGYGRARRFPRIRFQEWRRRQPEGF